VGVQGIVENIFHLMFIAMVTFGGLNVKQLGAKLILMGCDGSNVFQGAKAGITAQMKENVVIFMMGIHCFAHRTNLVVLVLSKLKLVVQLKALLQALYGFFSHSPKNFLKYHSLCDVLIDKGNKQLRNMQTRWINMLSLVKHVMEQYQPLIAKMHDMMF
jgi:hypothetical protein